MITVYATYHLLEEPEKSVEVKPIYIYIVIYRRPIFAPLFSVCKVSGPGGFELLASRFDARLFSQYTERVSWKIGRSSGLGLGKVRDRRLQQKCRMKLVNTKRQLCYCCKELDLFFQRVVDFFWKYQPKTWTNPFYPGDFKP